MNVEEHFYYLIKDGIKAVHEKRRDFHDFRDEYCEIRADFTFCVTFSA